ncbi:hypothetical protein [Glutamicibacter sp. NPDC087583]|uniref:competence protein CoiA family protein n=1 Tax=Glutamicibacter sp. NPDC087583 TaxID=3363995 RepID=UPI003816A102
MSTHLTCGMAHCTAKLHFRQGPYTAAHWAHSRGEAGECATMTGQPGEWHDRWQHGIFAGARSEVPLGGARADAILDRLSGKFAAIEFQHSAIDAGTVRKRIESHREAGAMASVWILNSAAAHPHRGFNIERTWAIDLLRAAVELGTRPEPGNPGFAVPVLLHKYGSLVVVDSVRFIDGPDGSEVAKVKLVKDKATGKTLRIPEETFRLWAAGANRKFVERSMPDELLEYAPRMDALTTRLVKLAQSHELAA